MTVWLVVGGCTAPPRLHGGSDQRPLPYIIGAAYDVEPQLIGYFGGPLPAAISSDLHLMKRLGFDAVLFRYVDQRLQPALAELAHSIGFTALLPCRDIHWYVLLGPHPLGEDDNAHLEEAIAACLSSLQELRTPQADDRHGIALARAPDSDRLRRGAGSAIALEVGSNAASQKHNEAIAARLAQRRLPYVLIPRGDSRTSGPCLIRIDVAETNPENGGTPLELWLAAYHRGLRMGYTAGVLFDRLRRIPGDGPDLVPRAEQPLTARIAAVKSLTARARAWGPLLQLSIPEVIDCQSEDTGTVECAVFVRGPRRYVLLFNASEAAFARGKIALGDIVAGSPVARAVEVPVLPRKPVGQVVKAAPDGVVIPVDLRPGDAALYELF